MLNNPNRYSPFLSKESANIFGQHVTPTGHVQLVVLVDSQVLPELFLHKCIAPN